MPTKEFVHKENYGSIFKNTQKQPGERTPDYRGKFTLHGQVFEIGLWVKDGVRGKYFSVQVREPRTKEGESVPLRVIK